MMHLSHAAHEATGLKVSSAFEPADHMAHHTVGQPCLFLQVRARGYTLVDD